MGDLHASLMIAVGKAALAKHEESCDLCDAEYSCVVANAHLWTLDRLRNPPTEGGDRG